MKKTTRNAPDLEQELYLTLFSEAADGIFVSDNQGNYIDVNPRGCKMLGYTRREILGMSMRDLIPAEELKNNPIRMDDLLAGKTVVNERRLRCKNGKLLPVEISGRLLSNGHLVGIVRDMSARKTAEEVIGMLARFPSEDPHPILRVGMDGKVLYANHASQPLLDEWKTGVGRALPKAWKNLLGRQSGDGSRLSVDVPCGERVFSVTFAPVADAGYINIYGRDVTKRKQAEEKLRVSEERFAKSFRMSPSGLVISRMSDGLLLEFNESFLEMFGYAREEMLGQTSLSLNLYADPKDRRRAISLLKKNGSVRQMELFGRRKNGVSILVELSAELITVGEESCLLAILRDITERKQAEIKIHESESRFRALIENSAEMILLFDETGVVTFASPSVSAILGFSPQEMTGRNFMEWVHPNELPLAVSSLESRSRKAGTAPDSVVLRVRHKDGGWRWVEGLGTNLLTDGAVRGIVINARDVTERVQAEEALKESEARFRSLYENSSIGMYRTTPDGRILLSNPALVKMLGFESFEELVKRNLEDRNDANYKRASFRERIEREGRIVGLESVWKKRDGTSVFVRESASLGVDSHSGEIYYEGTVEDITERRQMEEALEESEKHSRALFEDVPVAVWEEDFSEIKKHLDRLKEQGVTDFRGYFTAHPEAALQCVDMINILDMNNAALEMYQTRDKKKLLKVAMDNASRGELENNLEDVLAIAEGKTARSWEGHDETLTGKPLEINLSWAVVPGHEQDYSRVIVSTIDITERKQAEEAIRKSEEKYRGIFDDSIAAIYVFDNDKNFINANQAGLDLLGYARDELLRMSIPDVDADPIVVIPAHEELLTGGRLVNYEHRLRRKDGTVITVLNNSRPLTDQHGKVIGLLSTLIDVTERKQAEVALRRNHELQQALSRAAQSVQRAHTPEEIYRAVGEQFKSLGLDATVLTFDAEGRRLVVNYTTFAPQIIRAGEKLAGLKLTDYRMPISPESAYGRMMAAEKAEYVQWTGDLVAEALPKALRPLGGKLAKVLKIDQGIVAPLHVDEAALGLLTIGGSSLSVNDVPAVEAFAAQVSISLRNVGLMQKLQAELAERKATEELLRHKHDIQMALSRGAQAVQRARTPEEIYAAVGDQVKGLGLEATLFTRDPNGRQMKIIYTTFGTKVIRACEKLAGLTLEDYRLEISPDTVYGRLFATEKTEFLPSSRELVAEALPKALRPFGARLAQLLNMESGILAPLRMDDATLGLLGINGSNINREDAPAVETFAAQVSISLRNVRLMQDLHAELAARKQAEESLRVGEEKYRALIEQLPAITYVDLMDGKGTTLFVSPQVEAIYGITQQEWLERDISVWLEAIHPEDRQRVEEAYFQSTLTGQPFEIEYRVNSRNGILHWIQDKGSILKLETGETLLNGVMFDITERKQAEAQYRTIFEKAPVGIIQSTPEGRYTKVNAAMARAYGYDSPEDMLASITDIPSQVYVDAASRQEFKRLLAEKNEVLEFVTENKRKDGSHIWTSVDARTVRDAEGNILYYEGFVRDITGQKRTEERLQLQSAALEAAANTIVITDRQGLIEWANPSFTALTGFETGEAIGKNQGELTKSGKQDEAFYKTLWETILSGQVWHGELVNRRKDGRLYEEEMTITPLRNGQGEISHFIAVKQDITMRKQAEKSLNESQAQLSGVFNSAMDAIISTDADQNIVIFNPAAEAVFGCRQSEVIGQPLERFIPHRFRDSHRKHIENFAKNGLASRMIGHLGNVVGMRCNGEEFPIEASISRIQLEGGDLFTIILRDITERKQAEQALLDKERHSQSLLRLSKKLELSQTYHDVLNAAQEEVTSTLGYQNLWIYLMSEDRKYFKALTAGGLMSQTVMSEEGTATLTIEGDRMLEQLAEGKGIVVVEDARADPRTNKEIVEQTGIRTIINTPIFLFNEHLGAVGTGTFGEEGVRVPTDMERQYFAAMASHLAVTLDRIHLLAERRQAEESLRESEILLRESQAIAGLGSYVLDISSGSWNSSDVLDTVFGIDKVYEQTARGIFSIEGWVALVHPDDRAMMVDYFSAEVLGQGKDFDKEYRIIRHNDQAERWVHGIGKLEFDSQGHPLKMHGTIQDITGRKRHEHELEAEAMLAQALSESLELQPLLDQLLTAARHAIPAAEKGSLALMTDEEHLQVRAVSGYQTPDVMGYTYSIHWGYAGRVARERRPARIADIQTDSELHDAAESAPVDEVRGLRSAIAVPLLVYDRVIGVLSLESAHPEAFNEEDLRLLANFALSAALIIERARLFEATRHRVAELEMLYESGLSLSQLLTPKEIGRKVIELLEQKMDWHHTTVRLYHPQNETFEVLAFNQPSVTSEEERREAEARFATSISRSGEGLSGWAVQNSQIVRSGDVSADPRYAETYPGLHSGLYVPMKSGERAIGVISIESEFPNAFSEADERLVATLANQAASALENARLFEAEHAARKQSETLRQVAQVVGSTLEINEVIRSILGQLKHVITFDTASVFLTQETGKPTLATGTGYVDEKLTSQMAGDLLKDSPILAQMSQDLQPTILPDVREHPSWIWVPGAEHVRSFLAVPIIARQRMIGALMADSAQVGFFTNEDVRLAQSLAQHMAIAIENARLFEETRQRVTELGMVNRISIALRAVSKQDEMLAIVLEETLAALGAAHGSINLFNPSTGKLHKVIARGWVSEFTEIPIQPGEGIFGKVFTSGNTHASRDFANDPLTRPEARGLLPVGWGGACVPIRSSEKIMGVMLVSIPGEREFSKDEVRLLNTLAEMTGNALHRMRLHEETLRRAEEFASLYETNTAITIEHDLNTLLQTIVKSAVALLGATGGGMYMHEPASGEMVMVMATHPSIPVGTRLQMGEGVAGRVAQSRQPLRIDDYSTWEGRSSKYDETPIRAVLEAPILFGGELIGVLVAHEIDPSERKFTEADERLLALFAAQAAGVIRSARLREETERRLQNMQALREVDRLITSSFELRPILSTVVSHTISQLNVDAADILLLNSHLQTLEYAAGYGFHTRGIEHSNQHLGHGHAGNAALSRHTVHISNLPETGANFKRANLLAGENFLEYYGVPLLSKGEVKGVLEVFHRSPLRLGPEWLELLETLAGQAAIAIDNSQLFENIQRSNLELALAYDATIEGWSRAMDLRDEETEGHTQRVTEKAVALARSLGMRDGDVLHLRRGALLHDIGKIGVPDGILLKAGPLTDEEWVIMRRHPQFAYEMLRPIAYLHQSLDIPHLHHEKWDGTGYPQGLKGEQIPLAARIFAIVDVYDAVTSDRPYRKAWTQADALKYIREQSGKHFDPELVEKFLHLFGGVND